MNTLSVMPPRVAIRLLVLIIVGLLVALFIRRVALFPLLDMLKLNGWPTMNNLLILMVMLERIRSIKSSPVLTVPESVI